MYGQTTERKPAAPVLRQTSKMFISQPWSQPVRFGYLPKRKIFASQSQADGHDQRASAPRQNGFCYQGFIDLCPNSFSACPLALSQLRTQQQQQQQQFYPQQFQQNPQLLTMDGDDKAWFEQSPDRGNDSYMV